MGAFAMYHQRPAAPHPRKLEVVEAGAHLAGNVIERLIAERKLRESVERLDLAEEVAGFGIWERFRAGDHAGDQDVIGGRSGGERTRAGGRFA